MAAVLPKPATVQRLLGFAAGLGAAVVVYISFQRQVSRQSAEVAQKYGMKNLAPQPSEEDEFFGPRVRAALVRKWNKGIDATFGSLATELAKRGL